MFAYLFIFICHQIVGQVLGHAEQQRAQHASRDVIPVQIVEHWRVIMVEPDGHALGEFLVRY